MHIQKTPDIASMKQFGCYEVIGEVKNKPKVIEGGHMFFHIKDESGEIECGAYEPTKGFRNTVSYLRPGDVIRVFGGIGEQNTFNIEKFRIIAYQPHITIWMVRRKTRRRCINRNRLIDNGSAF